MRAAAVPPGCENHFQGPLAGLASNIIQGSLGTTCCLINSQHQPAGRPDSLPALGADLEEGPSSSCALGTWAGVCVTLRLRDANCLELHIPPWTDDLPRRGRRGPSVGQLLCPSALSSLLLSALSFFLHLISLFLPLSFLLGFLLAFVSAPHYFPLPICLILGNKPLPKIYLV